jgi:hypothetical protein
MAAEVEARLREQLVPVVPVRASATTAAEDLEA